MLSMPITSEVMWKNNSLQMLLLHKINGHLSNTSKAQIHQLTLMK